MPAEEKNLAHSVRWEGRVSYYDPLFRMLWLEHDHVGTYVPIPAPLAGLRTGQRVLIEGVMIPAKGLTADSVKVTVLQAREPVELLDTKGRINDANTLHGRIVRLEGYVDSQQLIDADHVRLLIISENRPLIGWVKPDNPNDVPNWQGQFVRVQALYSARSDPTQTRTTIELWMGEQDDIQTVGSINENPLFANGGTPVSELSKLGPGKVVKVRGQVVMQEVGERMIVRDETGQVSINSIQQQRIPVGTDVEVVGRVASVGAGWLLDQALYRRAKPAASHGNDSTLLQTVAEIRQLSPEEAAEHRPVRISGGVTWSIPGNDFFFLQDVSGGIRVHYDHTTMETPYLLKYLQVQGTTYHEGPTATVELKSFKDLGAMSPPTAKAVTYDQAISGKEDGQWVEMRGFIQRTVSEGDWRWIYVTTPSGEFVGHLQSPVNFVANPGSLIRVHGVCETSSDQSGRITRITLRVPFLHDITIEEDAPIDFYDLPLRTIRNLHQLGFEQNMTRVRVAGVVLHAAADGMVFMQEGNTALQIRTHESPALIPGDSIEAVGILGREGVRTILRDATYRKTGDASAPEPFFVDDPAQMKLANDCRLVRVRGYLIDVFNRRGQSRLTLQSGRTLFEAVLNHASGNGGPNYSVGTGLELTGIYRLAFDDSRQIREFELLLRSPSDITVFESPRLWTVQRMLVVAAILGGCTLLGLGWITALRRQVNQQTRLIRTQHEHQARLEAEVQRATRLESLGVLAGGIAHDFNNLLTIIMGNLTLIKFNKPVMESEGARVRDIEHGAARARDLTRQLLTFAVGGDPLRTNADLSEIVRDTAELVLHGSNVRYSCDVASNLRSALIDREQISQAVRNLVLNALRAMPEGGVLRIALANEEITVAGATGLAAGFYVRLTIADTGVGIAPAALPQLFDPYFSPKETGGGLGLATVYSIIKKHGGHIEVESQPGRGTTFIIRLPAAGEMPERPVESLPASAVSGGSSHPLARGPDSAAPRVLLMDDEESIRTLGANILERMGLQATVVPDGASALRAFEEAKKLGHPFSLIILDLTIPGGMGGKLAIEAIRQYDTSVPVIVSSGYSSDPVMASFEKYGFQAVVPKPYDLTVFTATIERLLPKENNRGV